MIKRTVYISKPFHLSIRDDQLILSDKIVEWESSVPIEDLGYLILDHQQITLTMRVMEKLSEYNIATVFCDKKHLPCSLNLPLDAHHIQNELFRFQIDATEPLKKKLWKQTVESKIHNQARLLIKLGNPDQRIEKCAKTVKSGDPDNREGVAAKYYWESLFGKPFIRDRFGATPNPLLNYGYILLRSAVARALAGSGLLATLGIHHKNRYNAFCLADDIMEPYRPYVDEIVYKLNEKYPESHILNKEIKAELLELLAVDVRIGKISRPLMIALTHTTASLSKCYAGKRKKIEYPVLT